jgi:hypothetical protein
MRGVREMRIRTLDTLCRGISGGKVNETREKSAVSFVWLALKNRIT